MLKRVPGSERTREALSDLIEGRLSSDLGRSELVRLATRLIVEEGLEAEVRDALGRDYYERGADAGGGYRNGLRQGRFRLGEVSGGVANIRQGLRGTPTSTVTRRAALSGDRARARPGLLRVPADLVERSPDPDPMVVRVGDTR